ncbi:hypothetical protein HN588_02330 [Candidatus Bathyarchaeota archaeon]|jgi:4a-hydroxytetrahydrobiopterin dehydratase|nr:hypothetical protein [Candidatus Bathyarchaeota archaeon]
MRLLQELRANITPGELERASLPSSVLRILPNAETMVGDDHRPVRVNRTKWERRQDPERLVRTYDFEDYDYLRMFVTDLLDYQQVRGHHADIKITKNDVTVSVWTHGITSVTEIDIEFAKETESIYQDVRFKIRGML